MEGDILKSIKVTILQKGKKLPKSFKGTGILGMGVVVTMIKEGEMFMRWGA